MADEKYFVIKSSDKDKPEIIKFPKSKFNKDQVEDWLKNHSVNNFFFFFDEPNEPIEFGDESLVINGEVGYDIKADSFINLINSGKEILLNTFGGDLWEGWRIHDFIKYSGKNPSIGVVGVCASSGIQILLGTDNRWGAENSRYLIHNPWTFTVGDDETHFREANNLAMEKTQLANKYAQVSGKSIEDIMAIMKEERMLNANEALELGLIKEIKTQGKNTPIVKKDEKMTNEEKEVIENWFTKLENKFFDLFKPAIKNMDITDVNGNQFHVVREEGEMQVGDEASPDGSYTLENGKTVKIESGKITEIMEPAPEESEEAKALKTENEALKAEITALKETQNKLNSDIETFNQKKTEVETLITELKNLKSTVTIDGRKTMPKQKTQTATAVDMGKVAETAKKIRENNLMK